MSVFWVLDVWSWEAHLSAVSRKKVRRRKSKFFIIRFVFVGNNIFNILLHDFRFIETLGMKKNKRLLALDVFRGATMMLMILVNTPGSWAYVYPPFRHAEWHGFTLTDLVFPFFMWIVGVSMYLSMQKKNDLSEHQKLKRLWSRAFKIFLIGALLRAFPFIGLNLGKFRIFGVLQRIGLAYGLAGTMTLKLSLKQLVISSVVILLGYWGVMYYFGGGDPYSLEENAARLLDLKVLGASHMWHGHQIAFDPEGLLSTFPSVVTILLGYFTAWLFKLEKDLSIVIKKMIEYGFIGLGFGVLWGRFFPINKALWTSSYVLVTAGIASIVLASLLWVIDVRGLRKWTVPFQIFGKNAILGFVLSGLIVKVLLKVKWVDLAGQKWSGYSWIFKKGFVPIFGNMNGSLFFALTTVGVVGLVLWFFWRKRWFLRV